MDNAASFGNSFAEAVTSGPLILGLLAAAVAGLVSFASPCVIPLVPGYISYLAGVVGGEVTFDGELGVGVGKRRQWAVVLAAALFILGFTVVFLLATVSVFGAISALKLNEEMLMRVGGGVTILMGVVFLGAIPALQKDTRMAPKRWTTWPCLGPTLAAIISVSAGTEGMTAARGVLLIIFYCLGLGLPFLLVALGSARAMRTISWARKHSHTIQIIGGVAMILVGLALVTGLWGEFISLIRQWTGNYGATLI